MGDHDRFRLLHFRTAGCDAQNVRVDTTRSDGIKLKLIPCTRKLSHFSRGHVGAFFAVEGVRDFERPRTIMRPIKYNYTQIYLK